MAIEPNQFAVLQAGAEGVWVVAGVLLAILVALAFQQWLNRSRGGPMK